MHKEHDDVGQDNEADQSSKPPALQLSERVLTSEICEHQHYVEIHGIAHLYEEGLTVLPSGLQGLALDNQVLEGDRDDQEGEDLNLVAVLNGHQDNVRDSPSQEDDRVPIISNPGLCVKSVYHH